MILININFSYRFLPVGLIYNIATKKYYSIEPYVEGEYKKYNSNHGYVTKNNQEASVLAQCFSHFTFQNSKKTVLVVDMQGIFQYIFINIYIFYLLFIVV